MTIISNIKKSLAIAAVLLFFSVFTEANSTTVIIDNYDSEFTTSGKWSGSGASDAYAGGSIFSRTLNSSATWTPSILEAGSYAVYVWYAGSTSYNRDTNADYTINHAGGSETIVIDQDQGSGKWVLLGFFTFNAGSNGNVTLLRNSESGGTSADAVKFVFMPESELTLEPIVTQPTPEPTPEPEVSACKSGPAQQLGQIKDSISGAGLVDVTVTIAGCSTKTDANGYYALNNIIIDDKAIVNFEKDGYSLGSTTIQIKELSGDNTKSPNYLEYSLNAYSSEWDNGREWTYESQNGATGGAVEIPANAIHTDQTGTVYNGTVSAYWVFKDTMTEEGRDAFSGAFKGINSNGVLVPFVSYGLTSLELEDKSGTSLNISEHITLILASVTGTTENILPLWYYDYDQGLWFEEGYAERQSDGTYRADISHAGTWSLSQPMEEEVGIYRGHIVNEDGSPLSDVRVYVTGDNWVSSDLITDENGLFQIEVIPGKSFKLSAYNYKDKYEAIYNGIIPAIAPGEIVED